MSALQSDGAPHSLVEDAQALLTGSLFFAFGIVLLKQAHLLTGGTAGLAVLVHYFSDWQTGAVLFVVNLPSYALALRSMGLQFTLRTAVAVSVVAGLIEWIPHWISIGMVHPAFAAVLGGSCAGAGILILIRHKASLGGLNVLCLLLQNRFGWRAGLVQLAFDLTILAAGLKVMTSDQLLWSVVGAVALNVVIAVNHRSGRYFGM